MNLEKDAASTHRNGRDASRAADGHDGGGGRYGGGNRRSHCTVVMTVATIMALVAVVKVMTMVV